MGRVRVYLMAMLFLADSSSQDTDTGSLLTATTSDRVVASVSSDSVTLSNSEIYSDSPALSSSDQLNPDSTIDSTGGLLNTEEIFPTVSVILTTSEVYLGSTQDQARSSTTELIYSSDQLTPTIMPSPSAAEPSQTHVTPSPSAAEPSQTHVTPSPSAAEPSQTHVTPSPSAAEPSQTHVTPSPSAAEPSQTHVTPSPSAAEPSQTHVTPSPSAAEPSQTATMPSPSAAEPSSAIPMPSFSEAAPTTSEAMPNPSISQVSTSAEYTAINPSTTLVHVQPSSSYIPEPSPDVTTTIIETTTTVPADMFRPTYAVYSLRSSLQVVRLQNLLLLDEDEESNFTNALAEAYGVLDEYRSVEVLDIGWEGNVSTAEYLLRLSYSLYSHDAARDLRERIRQTVLPVLRNTSILTNGLVNETFFLQKIDDEEFTKNITDPSCDYLEVLCPLGHRCFVWHNLPWCRSRCNGGENIDCGENGQCSLDSQTGNPVCRCSETDTHIYTGDRCDVKSEKFSMSKGAIIGLGVGISAGLVLILAVAVCYFLCKNRENHPQYSSDAVRRVKGDPDDDVMLSWYLPTSNKRQNEYTDIGKVNESYSRPVGWKPLAGPAGEVEPQPMNDV